MGAAKKKALMEDPFPQSAPKMEDLSDAVREAWEREEFDGLKGIPMGCPPLGVR